VKIVGMVGFALMSVLVAGARARAGGGETRATVVYDDAATEMVGTRLEGAELWVTTRDLTRATRFELKPQGVCRDELCFPLPRERRGEYVREDGGTLWFDLTAFARLVGQPYAYQAVVGAKENSGSLTPPKDAAIGDEDRAASRGLAGGAKTVRPEGRGYNSGIWYFGLRGDQRQGLASLTAPEFTLPDMAGAMHSLAEFRGKKILLVTWASW
jgi:hypothetical protein